MSDDLFIAFLRACAESIEEDDRLIFGDWLVEQQWNLDRELIFALSQPPAAKPKHFWYSWLKWPGSYLVTWGQRVEENWVDHQACCYRVPERFGRSKEGKPLYLWYSSPNEIVNQFFQAGYHVLRRNRHGHFVPQHYSRERCFYIKDIRYR